MGIWQFANGPIAELALLAVAAGSVVPATVAHGPDRPTVAATSLGTIVAVRPPAMVDFTLVSGQPGMAIRRAGDGLFYCNGWVNGVPVRFLVDTGATTVVLTPADAARVGVMPEAAAFRHSASTAGGPVAMARIRLAQLAAGSAERRDIEAAIAGSGLGVSLLGQSYLSQLASVRISGDTMVLE
jgi:aspartyl protease family protein